MDELFAKYMYYLRAGEEIRNTTTESLRTFFDKDKYRRLKNENTIPDLLELAHFWEAVHDRDSTRFSDETFAEFLRASTHA